jgi:signal transduction histidine kinase
MMNLIEDITDYSKIQLQKFDIYNSWFSFKEITDDVFQMLDFQASFKHVKLAYPNDEELMNTGMYSDKKRI